MRVRAELWVKAYVRTLAAHGVPAFVCRRGDEDGGAVYIRLNRLDGTSGLYGPASAGLWESASDRRFSLRMQAEDARVEEAVSSEVKFDPDLWLIEVEDKEGRHFLDEWLISI